MNKIEFKKNLKQFEESKKNILSYFGLNISDGWRDFTNINSWVIEYSNIKWNETDKDYKQFIKEYEFMYSEYVADVIEEECYTMVYMHDSYGDRYFALFDNDKIIVLD